MPSESEISDLKKQRATIQGTVTRLKNYINENATTLNTFDLQTRLGLLENYFSQFFTIHSRIESNSEEVEAEGAKFDAFQDSYCATKSKILELIDKHKPTPENSATSTPKAMNTQTSFSLSNSRNVNLPKLKLPTFSGKYTEWNNFIQTFETLVDSDSELTFTEKFQHLRSCLSERPLRKIEALEITSQNYQQALQILKSHYDNSSIIFKAHVKEIFSITPVNRNSPSQLRDLIDSVNVHLRSLKSLGSTEELLDTILLHIFSSKLDSETKDKWEDERPHDKLPTWEQFSTFLGARCLTLESRDVSAHSKPQAQPEYTKFKNKFSKHNKSKTSLSVSVGQHECLCCNSLGHTIHTCSRFKAMSPLERYFEGKRLSLCLVCLSPGHTVRKCAQVKCVRCNGRHHVLLHRDVNKGKHIAEDEGIPSSSTNATSHLILQNTAEGNSTNISEATALNVFHSYSPSNNSPNVNLASDNVLLATAVIFVKNNAGVLVPCRALLDSGSQLNFITEQLVQQLNLKRTKIQGSLKGIGNSHTNVKLTTTATIKSRLTDFVTTLKFWILPAITDCQPNFPVKIDTWKIPADVKLADPCFERPQKIDMLLGASIFFQLLSTGQIELGSSLPLVQNTLLGWIIAGTVGTSRKHEALCSLSGVNANDSEEVDESMDKLLTRFWSIEELAEIKSGGSYSSEQQECEDHFRQHVVKTKCGRLSVKLPLKASPLSLGDSLETACMRWINLEKRLEKNLELKSTYRAFIEEYLRLGHMEAINKSDLSSYHYFMPHHCVIRPESSTTKLRVVFDASCKTTSGLSLNDIMMVGPVLQSELFDILIRFRTRRFAITGDISKMYRQILVHDQDKNLQCIVWRNNPRENLQFFRLKTVTYGTAAAPYLATRSLKLLAESNKLEFPVGSRVLEKDFYVDDMLSGADTIEEAIQVRQEITEILKQGCFDIHKWRTNDPLIIESIHSERTEKTLNLHDSNVTKTLGVIWEPSTDQFCFRYKESKSTNRITKRSVLSDLCRLFDPLGLINPVVVLGKIFVQELWLKKVSWDEALPDKLATQWEIYKHQLSAVKKIKFPRFIGSKGRLIQAELHGFADASQRAYGCCIYFRIVDEFGNIYVNLLCAKSKVAPVKTISLPRLELCGTQLLAQLLHRIRSEINIPINKVHGWTDSQIVLDWLSKHPSTWTTYVSNRVSLIQELIPDITWTHIDSKENPADIISRGMLPEMLLQSDIWFNGPSFLSIEENKWPKKKCVALPYFQIPERRTAEFSFLSTESEDMLLDSKFINSLAKLRRMMAYVLRFIYNARAVARRVVHRCLRCFRTKPRSLQHIMGNLPQHRVQPARPFINTGVDFCGPVYVHIRMRGKRPYKAYICVFVCFSTKAVHLEAVTDLTTQAFIAALKRFIARRGLCRNLYCDNATNFAGAKRELRELHELFNRQESKEELVRLCAEDSISFHNIPPRCPHFGGLWESAVKAAKYHLNRIVRQASLSFEELNTVLTQIEAILNSRPLTPLSSDPSDLEVLTPGHFLIGAPLVAIVEPDLKEIPMSRLSRWQHIQSLQQHFWKRWSKEYLVQLQQRTKWVTSFPNIKINTLVLIADDDLPPQKWLMGRVVETYPGKHGVVRVASVRTRSGILQRSVQKLCPLPIDESVQD